jgi:CspA family cold shock protein
LTDYEYGIVKWFDSEKGYGFIERWGGGEIYVHYSAIRCDESDCELYEGQRSAFC